jgi:TetR/AcrR family transcriptional regulator, lmrAB and yxaGH operons repressor
MARGPSKRSQLVDATVTLLRKGGLSGASLNRTLEASGAPKGSLYHYFPGGKSQLISEALQKFSDDFSGLLERSWRPELAFEERWTALVDAMARGLRRSDFALGCPVAATLLDLEGDDQAVHQVAQASFDRWIGLLAAGLPELSPKAARTFAQSLLALLEGALILARAQRSDVPLRQARDFALAAWKQLA